MDLERCCDDRLLPAAGKDGPVSVLVPVPLAGTNGGVKTLDLALPLDEGGRQADTVTNPELIALMLSNQELVTKYLNGPSKQIGQFRCALAMLMWPVVLVAGTAGLYSMAPLAQQIKLFDFMRGSAGDFFICFIVYFGVLLGSLPLSLIIANDYLAYKDFSFFKEGGVKQDSRPAKPFDLVDPRWCLSHVVALFCNQLGALANVDTTLAMGISSLLLLLLAFLIPILIEQRALANFFRNGCGFCDKSDSSKIDGWFNERSLFKLAMRIIILLAMAPQGLSASYVKEQFEKGAPEVEWLSPFLRGLDDRASKFIVYLIFLGILAGKSAVIGGPFLDTMMRWYDGDEEKNLRSILFISSDLQGKINYLLLASLKLLAKGAIYFCRIAQSLIFGYLAGFLDDQNPGVIGLQHQPQPLLVVALICGLASFFMNIVAQSAFLWDEMIKWFLDCISFSCFNPRQIFDDMCALRCYSSIQNPKRLATTELRQLMLAGLMLVLTCMMQADADFVTTYVAVLVGTPLLALLLQTAQLVVETAKKNVDEHANPPLDGDLEAAAKEKANRGGATSEDNVLPFALWKRLCWDEEEGSSSVEQQAALTSGSGR